MVSRLGVMMEEWRLLEDAVPKKASANLAVDEAVFTEKTASKGPPTVRFWRSHPAVVIGHSQAVEAEVNLGFCGKKGIEVVRRFSGGGAVYQDPGTLNYSITIDADHPLVKGKNVVQSQEAFCSGVIASLKAFSVRSAFEAPSNILINGKKVSGNAQARRKGVVLHHGTLLVSADLDSLVRSLDIPNPPKKAKGVRSKRSPVTNLSVELSRPIPIGEIVDALRLGFEEIFSARFFRGSLSGTEKNLADRFYTEKYSQDEWNFWR